jgi:hypothetical protein
MRDDQDQVDDDRWRALKDQIQDVLNATEVDAESVVMMLLCMAVGGAGSHGARSVQEYDFKLGIRRVRKMLNVIERYPSPGKFWEKQIN